LWTKISVATKENKTKQNKEQNVKTQQFTPLFFTHKKR